MTNAELKAAIVAAVYENTEGAITGDALQDILLKIVEQFEVPYFDLSSGATSVTGTLAECAAAAGVSENMFLRLCHGEVPVVNLGYGNDREYYSASLGVRSGSIGPIVYKLGYDAGLNYYTVGSQSVQFSDIGGGSYSFVRTT